jgi:hypothetical protein
MGPCGEIHDSVVGAGRRQIPFVASVKAKNYEQE